MHNHAYMVHQAQINSQPYLYEEPNIYFLILNPTEHNFIAGFFQDGSLGNLSSLSQTSQKTLLNLSKGDPNLPIVDLQQLYGILTSKPLKPDIFIHLIHQLLMEITPGHLVDDINLICPKYPKQDYVHQQAKANRKNL